MKKAHLIGGGLTLLASFMLVACNDNDDDNANSSLIGGGTNNNAAQTQNVTISPSLGKIFNAKVVLKNAKTGAELGSGTTGTTGVATITATKTTDPVVVEVQGQANAKYFDESKNAEVNFESGKMIRAALPSLSSSVGVSALTEVAYQAALKKANNNVASITSEIATNSNEAIRKALAPELTSITAVPPHLVGSVAELATITNTEAGKYALRLAALAKLASNTDATPALTVLNQLSADIADGNFDGMANGIAVTAYTQANLQSKIQANLESTIAAANLSGFNVSAFTLGFGAITVNISGTGGGTGSGQNCALNANYNIAGIAASYTICYTNFPQNAICGAGNQAFSNADIPGFNGTINWTYSQVATCPAGSIQVNYVN